MKNPSPGVKNIITPTEAIDYFVLSRRKFYDLLKSDAYSAKTEHSLRMSGALFR